MVSGQSESKFTGPTCDARPPFYPSGRGEIRSWGTLAAAFLLGTWASWRTWPDLLIDFGHELYIPWRICNGAVLYRDIAFAMGPLSQYANALLFQLFGISLATLIWANLALLVAILAMLLWIFRRFGSRGSATFVGLFFLAVFAFAQYRLIGNYNYVCPYRHEVTHGLVLGLANLICMVRWGETRQIRWVAAGGFCLGLTALTKAEMLLPAVMTMMAAILLFLRRGCRVKSAGGDKNQALDSAWPTTKHVVLSTFIEVIAAAVPIAAAFFGLAYFLGWKGAWDGIHVNYQLAFDPKLTVRSGFYTALSGFNHPSESAMALCRSTFGVLAVAMAAGATSWLAESFFIRASRTKMWAIAVGIVVALSGLTLLTQRQWSSIPAALPVLLPVVVVVSFRRAISQSPGPGPVCALCLLAVYAVGLLPKILLKADWGHYGFLLAMPGTLVLVHVAIHSIPRWLEQRIGTGNTFRAVAIGLLSACALFHASIWMRIDHTKTLAIGSGGDRFYVDPKFDDRSVPTALTLEYLQSVMRNDETLAVFPEGTTLNYLLRKRNPTPFLMVNPFEFDAFGGEERVLESLNHSAPDYIVFVTMNMAVHGRGEFGNPQFGGMIRAFIEDQYEIVDRQMSQAASGGPPTFQSTVFRRRKTPQISDPVN